MYQPPAVHVEQYKDAYPKAKLIGVADLVEKKKGEVVFDGGGYLSAEMDVHSVTFAYSVRERS